MSIAGAVALKSVIDEIGGAIYVYGTPAEENFGGKVQMAKAHAFDMLDVALMIHPGTKTGSGEDHRLLFLLNSNFMVKVLMLQDHIMVPQPLMLLLQPIKELIC